MPQDHDASASTEHQEKSIRRRPRVAEAAEARLRQSKFLELRAVSCEFDEGVLTLHGRVPSYYLKQMAQSLLDRMPEVLRLDNQLEVGLPRSPNGPFRRSSHGAAPASRRPR